MESKPPLRLPVRGSKNPFEAHKEAEAAKRRRLARPEAHLLRVQLSFGVRRTKSQRLCTRASLPTSAAKRRCRAARPLCAAVSWSQALGQATSLRVRRRGEAFLPITDTWPADTRQGALYVPSFLPPQLFAGREKAATRESPQEPLRSTKKTLNIGSVLEELQREQQERHLREERLGVGVLPEVDALQGSHSTGDAASTNLFVGNLAPTLDEHALKVVFGRYGPLASVKIFWPREDGPQSTRVTGFVAFMARHCAEDALAALQGTLLHNCELRMGWGKAVPIPQVPCWPSSGVVLETADAGLTVSMEAATREPPLLEEERLAFEAQLRALTMARAAVREAMLYALDHADSATALGDVLVQAVSLPEIPAATKVAQLFLLSDILHNCSSPAAPAGPMLRKHLLSRLPEIFHALRVAYAAVDSRITAQTLRRHVMNVLRAWESWCLLGSSALLGLEATFLHTTTEAPLDPTLRSTLESLPIDELLRRCRDSMQLTHAAGDDDVREACIKRLEAVDTYRRTQLGESTLDSPLPSPAELATCIPLRDIGSWTVLE